MPRLNRVPRVAADYLDLALIKNPILLISMIYRFFRLLIVYTEISIKTLKGGTNIDIEIRVKIDEISFRFSRAVAEKCI